MDSLRKIAGTLAAILFVITSVPALVFFNLDRTGFTAETYRQVFSREGFYNRLPRVLAETINSTSFIENDLPLAMRGMGLPAWEAFLRAMLPPDTLQALGDETLASLFAYLNMEADRAEMPLVGLKRNMLSDLGVEAVFALLATQPECSVDQVARMTIGLLAFEEIQFCNPPERLRPVLTPVIGAQLQVTAAAIPDHLTLVSAENAPPGQDPRLGLLDLRRLMRLTPLLPLALLLALTILMVNSAESWLDWWGGSFLAAGAFAFAVGLSGSPILGGILRRTLTREAPAYLPVAFWDYAGDMAAAMVAAMLKPVRGQGLILGILGLIMLLASILLHRRAAARTPPSERKTIVD